MDDSAATIEKELDEKSIERTDQPNKKTKKKKSDTKKSNISKQKTKDE